MNELKLAVTALQELIAWFEDSIYDGEEPFAIFNARCTLDSIGSGEPHRLPELHVGPLKEKT